MYRLLISDTPFPNFSQLDLLRPLPLFLLPMLLPLLHPQPYLLLLLTSTVSTTSPASASSAATLLPQRHFFTRLARLRPTGVSLEGICPILNHTFLVPFSTNHLAFSYNGNGGHPFCLIFPTPISLSAP